MPRSVRHRRAALPAALSIALSLAWAGAALAAGPDAALLQAAQAAQPGVVQSLKEMVSIESGSHDVDGLNRMAAYTEKRLKALGASVERVPAAQGHGPIVKGTLEGTGRGPHPADRPHGHRLPAQHAGLAADPRGRQQALRAGYRG